MSNALLDAALGYAAKGWAVLPLKPSKAPYTDHGLLDATCDATTITQWWTQWPSANIGIATGEVSGFDAVDVDPKNGGEASLEKLIATQGTDFLETLTIATGGAGAHLYYAHVPGLRNSASSVDLGSGIDVRADGGYVVAPPSVHASGELYSVATDIPVAPAPAWLAALAQSRPAKRDRDGQVHEARDASAQTDEWVREELGKLANPENRALMALVLEGKSFAPAGARDTAVQRVASIIAYVAPDRDPVELATEILGPSLESFAPDDLGKYTQADRIEWAAEKIGRAQEDARRDRAADEQEREANAGIAGVLLKTKNKAPTNPIVEAEQALAKAEKAHKVANESGEGVEAWTKEVKRLIAVIADLYIQRLNAKHAWIERHVVCVTPKKVSYQDASTFRTTYDNQLIKIAVGDKVKTVGLGSYWLTHKDRTTYEELGMWAPPLTAPHNALNLWAGFAVEPKAGPWPLMKDHILTIICDGDVVLNQYFLNWIAWTFQNPGKPAEAAVAMRGTKGAGKGYLGNAIRTIFGRHAKHLSKPEQLVGKFNSLLEDAVFVFADECLWPGHKASEGQLKAMITESTHVIEPKGVSAYETQNSMHIMLATDGDWIVPADHDERRYVVTDVSPSRVGNFPYFTALREELESGGYEAMLYELLNVDLQGWHPRRVVNSAALQKQKERSLAPIPKWLFGILKDGDLFSLVKGSTPYWVPTPRMTEHLQKSPNIPDKANIQTPGVMEVLRDIGCTSSRPDPRGPRGWLFPDLNTARAAWDKKYGRHKWEIQTDWSGH